MAQQNFSGLNKYTISMAFMLGVAIAALPMKYSMAETITITPPDSKFFDKFKSEKEKNEEQQVQEMLQTLKVEEDLNFQEHGFLRDDKAFDRADFLIKSGQLSKAMGVVDHLLLRHPDNAEVYVYKGYLFKELKDIAQARKAFKKALILDPTHLGALYQMALVDAQDKNIAQAQEKLTLIRMYCGHTDCAEATQLEIKLDKLSKG